MLGTTSAEDHGNAFNFDVDICNCKDRQVVQGGKAGLGNSTNDNLTFLFRLFHLGSNLLFCFRMTLLILCYLMVRLELGHMTFCGCGCVFGGGGA
jgi:hypothetical protein